MASSLRNLPATVWLLGFVSLINDTASELVYPLLPLYLVGVLAAGPAVLGLIEGIAEAVASLMKLVSGVLADRWGKSRPMVILGYAVSGLGRPLLGLVGSWPFLLLLRFSDRLGKGLRASPRDALLARSITPEQRGAAFGLHKALDNTGAVIGPLLASALLAAQVPIRDIFIYTILPGALVLVLTLMVREPKMEVAPASERFRLSLAGFPSSYRAFLCVLALFTLGHASSMFVLARGKDLGLPVWQVPMLWAVVNLAATLFSIPLARWSDSVGRFPVITIGWALFALVFLMLALPLSVPVVWAVFVFYGIFLAATEGVQRALIADIAPRELLGTAYGWFHLVNGLLLLPASWLFGQLWEHINVTAAFGFSATCAVIAVLLLQFWVRPLWQRERAAG